MVLVNAIATGRFHSFGLNNGLAPFEGNVVRAHAFFVGGTPLDLKHRFVEIIVKRQ